MQFARQETFHGSYISLNEADKKPSRKPTMMNNVGGGGGGVVNQASAVGQAAVSNSLLTDDYFSNLNPRSMKRIVNTLTLSGILKYFSMINYGVLNHYTTFVRRIALEFGEGLVLVYLRRI